MARNSLIKTGRLFAVLLFMLYGANAHAAELTASLSRSIIAAGQAAELVISVKDGSDVDVRDVPSVKGLRIDYGGTGHSYQFINGRTSSAETITFRIYGEQEGTYSIPPFCVTSGGEKLYTRPLSITVIKGNVTDDGENGYRLFCDVEVSSDTAYAGQPVIMRYYIYHDEGTDVEINRITEAPLSKGFIIKGIREKMAPASVVKNGIGMIRELAASYCLIPEIPGDCTAGGGSMYVAIEQGHGFFSMPMQNEVRFPEKRIRIKPLPEKGKPAGYNGDVGSFVLEASLRNGEYRVNEEIQIPVTVSGKGNFLIMSKPVFENNDGIRLLVEENEPELSLDGSEISGTKKFLITLIPQKEGSVSPGKLFLTYFNPASGAYGTASAGPFSLEIKGFMTPSAPAKEKQDEAAGLSLFAYVAAGVLLLGALSAAAFIFFRERKRYGNAKLPGEKYVSKGESGLKEDPAASLRDDLAAARASGDIDRMMKLYFKAMDVAVQKLQEGPGTAGLYRLRDRLDTARYANAVLDSSEMEEIYQTLIAYLR